MDKKALKLGMNYSTAANRLRSDLLYHFAIKFGHKCHRCSKDLTRETFSVEHIEPWLNSDDPVKNFFDISNIAFSHQSCNYSHGGKGAIRRFSKEQMAERKRTKKRESYCPIKRAQKYERLGT